MSQNQTTASRRRNTMLLSGMTTAIAALAAKGTHAQGFYQYTTTVGDGSNSTWNNGDHNYLAKSLSFAITTNVALPGLKTTRTVSSVVFTVNNGYFTGSQLGVNNADFSSASFWTSFGAYVQLAIPGVGTYNSNSQTAYGSTTIGSSFFGSHSATFTWSSASGGATLTESVAPNADFVSSGSGNFGNMSGLNFNALNFTSASCSCPGSSGLESGYVGLINGASITVRYNLSSIPAPSSLAVAAPSLGLGLLALRRRLRLRKRLLK